MRFTPYLRLTRIVYRYTDINIVDDCIISWAIILSYSIEISQLYHAAWIDAIRNTTLGGLILGFGFLWSDLVCYTIGIIVGAIIDIMINKINIKVISNVER